MVPVFSYIDRGIALCQWSPPRGHWHCIVPFWVNLSEFSRGSGYTVVQHTHQIGTRPVNRNGTNLLPVLVTGLVPAKCYTIAGTNWWKIMQNSCYQLVPILLPCLLIIGTDGIIMHCQLHIIYWRIYKRPHWIIKLAIALQLQLCTLKLRTAGITTPIKRVTSRESCTT